MEGSEEEEEESLAAFTLVRRHYVISGRRRRRRRRRKNEETSLSPVLGGGTEKKIKLCQRDVNGVTVAHISSLLFAASRSSIPLSPSLNRLCCAHAVFLEERAKKFSLYTYSMYYIHSRNCPS